MEVKRNLKGFTLIELLIVITIIGILAVAFLPSILGAPAKARDTQRVASVNTIQEAIFNANLSNSVPYPSASGCFTAVGAPAGFTLDHVDGMGGTIPLDPAGGIVSYGGGATDCPTGGFLYASNPENADRFSFGIYTQLENEDLANFDCDLLTDDGVSDFDDTTYETTAIELENGEYCYGILVQ